MCARQGLGQGRGGPQRTGKVGRPDAPGPADGLSLVLAFSTINRGAGGLTLAVNPQDTGMAGCNDFNREELTCSDSDKMQSLKKT